MKEKILSTFKEMGFLLDDLEGYYGFEYEGKHFLYMYNENDDDFLSIACPIMIEKDEIGELIFYQLMNKVNSTLKYIKANTIDNSLWLFYERELCGENLEEVITRMILNLDLGYKFVQREIQTNKDDTKTGNDGSNATEDTEREDAA